VELAFVRQRSAPYAPDTSVSDTVRHWLTLSW
jgi:hypothetical protein